MALDITKAGVIDPYKHKEKFEKWIKEDTKNKDIFKKDMDLIKTYLKDMAEGINCSHVKKGSRGFARLNSLKSRIPKICSWVKQEYNKRITEITEDEIIKLFTKIEKGKITKANGELYASTGDYTKDFTAFWHWWMKYSKKQLNKKIEDITEGLSSSQSRELHFNYFDDADFKKLMDEAKTDYQDLMVFLFDSGIRAPTELMNVRIKDLTYDKDSQVYLLHIRKETSKTIPRKIKLLVCSQRIKERIERLKLKHEEFLFKIKPCSVNAYLNRLGYKILGFGERKERIKHEDNRTDRKVEYFKNGLTLYDFRHASACYWLRRYKNQNQLMYRFGWKNYKMIEHYTHYLGMKDDIKEDDLLVDVTKTELEKQMQRQARENELLKDKMELMEKQFDNIKAKVLKDISAEILAKINPSVRP